MASCMAYNRTDNEPTVDDDALASALETVRIEQQALEALEAALIGTSLGDGFRRALDLIAASSGRVIATGIGKSGIIARKTAATMMSMGTPAAFLHPGDASHGDLGMVTRNDVVLAFSWSGETAEVDVVTGYARAIGATLIVATSRADGSAGRAADVCLALPPVEEACPHQLAPTASTTMQAALGDALAIALARRRGFTRGDFRRLHPGGRLGAKAVSVGRLMGSGEATPVVPASATLIEATVEMSRKRYGCTAVVDGSDMLIGAFTDGDLRRSFAAGRIDAPISEHMTPQPLSVPPHTSAADALRIMNDHAVSVLFVCDDRRLLGVVHVHDVVRAGIA